MKSIAKKWVVHSSGQYDLVATATNLIASALKYASLKLGRVPYASKSCLPFFHTHTMSQQQQFEDEEEDYGPLPISQLEVNAAYMLHTLENLTRQLNS